MYDLNILKSIRLESICNLYRISLKRKGKYLVGKIRNEKTESFFINESKNTWKDYGINEGGDTIALISYLENVDRGRAIHILANRFNIKKDRKPQILPTEKQFSKINIIANRVLSNFIIDLNVQSIEQLEKWEKHYSISMYDLAKSNINMYHKILYNRAYPLIYNERKEFYEILHKYKTYGNNNEKYLLLGKLEILCKSINSKIDIYNQARLDKKLISYLKVNLNEIKEDMK